MVNGNVEVTNIGFFVIAQFKKKSVMIENSLYIRHYTYERKLSPELGISGGARRGGLDLINIQIIMSIEYGIRI